MHFRITGFIRILRGAGGIDDGRIDNSAALHHVASLYHGSGDRVKKQLVRTIRFQKMAEFAQCCFVRRCVMKSIPVNFRMA